MSDLTGLSGEQMILRIQRMEEDCEAYETMMENHKGCIADLETECERLSIENKEQVSTRATSTGECAKACMAEYSQETCLLQPIM